MGRQSSLDTIYSTKVSLRSIHMWKECSCSYVLYAFSQYKIVAMNCNGGQNSYAKLCRLLIYRELTQVAHTRHLPGTYQPKRLWIHHFILGTVAFMTGTIVTTINWTNDCNVFARFTITSHWSRLER